MVTKDAGKTGARQLLHLVFGGELTALDRIEFTNYAQAYDAWREASQRHVDDAHMRYFIVHLHRLLDPETQGGAGAG